MWKNWIDNKLREKKKYTIFTRHLYVGNYSFESVANFKHTGAKVNDNNANSQREI